MNATIKFFMLGILHALALYIAVLVWIFRFPSIIILELMDIYDFEKMKNIDKDDDDG